MEQFSSARWSDVQSVAQSMLSRGLLSDVSIATGTADQRYQFSLTSRQTTGVASIESASPVFLTASITKPIVATSVVLAIQSGEIALADRICDFLPAFRTKGKYGMELRHLLTHSGGLPDQLPNNLDLRRNHASLDEFVAGAAECELLSPVGRAIHYSSMGFAVLGSVLEKIHGRPLGQILSKHVFRPLKMRRTWLGASSQRVFESPLVVELPDDQVGGDDWNWNSAYWHSLGAPWGGLLSTVDDLASFCQGMLNPQKWELLPIARDIAWSRQTDSLRELGEADRRLRPWGLGWRWNWPGHSFAFGDFLTESCVGHWGATGTLLWIDPQRSLFAVILTTTPQDRSRLLLQRLSNVITACWGP